MALALVSGSQRGPDFVSHLGQFSLSPDTCLFGLLTAPQQRALFRLVLHNRSDLMAQMPMRICHPPWRPLSG